MIEEPTVIQDTPPVIEVVVTGKLELADYDSFIPPVEALIREHGKVRLLVRLASFEGWTAGALWEDIKFDVKHFNDIERLAIVGAKTWEKGMTQLFKPFTTATVRFYTPDQLDAAKGWVCGAGAREHAEHRS